MSDKLKDSGERRQFDTGAVRDVTKGKGRYDLLSPIAMHRYAKHTQNGAEKYADRNWEQGIPFSVFIDSALRHIFQFLEGDRSEDHLAAAMWNVAGCMHTEEMVERGVLPCVLDDLPTYKRSE